MAQAYIDALHQCMHTLHQRTQMIRWEKVFLCQSLVFQLGRELMKIDEIDDTISPV